MIVARFLVNRLPSLKDALVRLILNVLSLIDVLMVCVVSVRSERMDAIVALDRLVTMMS